MSRDLSTEAMLKKAQEHERKYEWFEAAKAYEQALPSKTEKPSSDAEIWKSIGFCYNLASNQIKNPEEFKKLMQLAVEAYKKAATLFEKEDRSKNQGKNAQCNTLAEYIRSWLASSSSEKKKILYDCRTFGNKALEAYKTAKDDLGYGQTCNTLLFCFYELLRLASDAEEKRSIAQEGIACGKKAISLLSKLKNKRDLLQAYSLTCLHNWYFANILEDEDEIKELARTSLSYIEKALAISEEVDNPYLTAISRWAAALCTLFFTGNVESSLEYAEEMLKQSSIVRDNYLKGVASYILAFATDWKVLKEVDPNKTREGYEKIIKYAEDAIDHFQLVSQDLYISETYLFYTESHSLLAREVEVDIRKKRVLLEKAIEIGRNGLEHANRFGSPDTLGSTLHALSKALHFYSNLESRKDEKIKLLEEALDCRKKYVQIVEEVFPSSVWIRGIGKNYTALIEAELTNLETDKDKKIVLLKNAVSNLEDAISYCTKWISSRPVQSRIVIVAGFENTFGQVLNDLYLLTEDKDVLSRAIEVYYNASEKFKKGELPSRAAESYWKIARVQDGLGEHPKAAKSFEYAFAEYKAASRRLPQFEDFYLDYSVYMKAWSEIESAKTAHNQEEYVTAMEHYARTANLLSQSKLWSYLSSNFLAWSFLEKAEDLSRKENSTQSIESFKKTTELFSEAKRTLRVKLDRIENTDEKDLAKRLITASDTRRKYCLGRIAIEEAKFLDKRGDHIASSKKYGFAAATFQEMSKVESGQTRRELTPLIYLCQAWQKMMMAESRASPIMYEEAADLFKQANEYTLDQQTSLLALAHSSFCRALEAGTEFEITRDTITYSTAKKHMEAAANYYLKAGFETASEYAKATQRLFDAYVYIDNAKKETDPQKEARYYVMAEKVLQISAESFMNAKHPEKIEQVQKLLKNVRDERELALSLSDVLHAPTMASSTASFTTLTPSEEIAVGLERFEHPDIQAKLIQPEKEIRVGEDFTLEMHVVNVGKETVLLTKIEEILPAGFQLVGKPDYSQFKDTYLDMKGKRLDPLKTEEIKLTFKSFDIDTFEIKPRIVCVDETGKQMVRELESLTITVLEVVLPGRITTGYKELDNLLFGGIPENYTVILTSPSCDERDLLIKRFLETGAKNGQITFYITVEVSGVKTLVEDFQSNFYLFICNPRADTMIESLPNVFKLTGVGNLTNINIALIKAFRRLDESVKGPRRACIEIVSDVLLRHHAVSTRRWLSGLIPDLRSKGFTTLGVMNPLMHPPEELHAILGLFEGEINIYEKDTQQFLRIKKMVNQKYMSKALLLRK